MVGGRLSFRSENQVFIVTFCLLSRFCAYKVNIMIEDEVLDQQYKENERGQKMLLRTIRAAYRFTNLFTMLATITMMPQRPISIYVPLSCLVLLLLWLCT